MYEEGHLYFAYEYDKKVNTVWRYGIQVFIHYKNPTKICV